MTGRVGDDGFMHTPRSLDSLVEKAGKGEQDAWKILVDRLTPWALRYARRRLPQCFCAEDAVQEALLVACRNLGDLREKTAFFAWFKAILGSQCIRLASSHPPEASLEQLDAWGLLPPSTTQAPEDALWAVQLRAACEDALDELPLHLRQVCRLHYLQGLSVPEVSCICWLPEGTVKKRLYSARRLLMERLAGFHVASALRVGYMPISDHLLPMCADYLNQGGSLRLHSRRYLSWAALTGDLKRGKLDAAFIMAPLALHLLQSGTPLLYIMDGHHDGSSVAFSRRAHPERRMGLPGELSTHRVLLSRLMREQPELFDLPTMVVNPSAVIASMRQNKIGAFFCGEPWSAKCVSQGLGDAVLGSRDIEPGHLCCILAVRKDFALRRDNAAAEYVQALRKARDRVRRNPDFGAGVQAAYTGIDASLALQVLERRSINFDDLAPDQGRMEAFARMAREAGVLTSPCSLDGFARREFFGPSSS